MAVKKAVEGPLSCEGEAPVVVPFSTTLTSMCLDIHLDLELWLAFLFLLIGGIFIVVWHSDELLCRKLLLIIFIRT